MKIVSIIVSLFAAVAFANPTSPAPTTTTTEVATPTPEKVVEKTEKKLHKKVKAAGKTEEIKNEEVKTETK